jgi:acid phosphatase type 7
VASLRRASLVVVGALALAILTASCAPQQEQEETIVAAGDIAACSSEGDEATAKLVGGIDGSMVLALGDNAYPDGSAEDFHECYKPTWGRFEWRTKPVPGNHEYETPNAQGYFDYFGKEDQCH